MRGYGILFLCLMCMGLACRSQHEIIVRDQDPHVLEISFNKPLEINMNINLKVDRALDDFFGEIDQ